MKRNKSFEVKEMKTRSPLSLQGMKKYSIISAVRNPIKKEENRRRKEKKKVKYGKPFIFKGKKEQKEMKYP